MADWTNLPNTAVGVGGLPSGTTVTALRDNPVAIAEGAAGAPRLYGKAAVPRTQQAELAVLSLTAASTFVLDNLHWTGDFSPASTTTVSSNWTTAGTITSVLMSGTVRFQATQQIFGTGSGTCQIRLLKNSVEIDIFSLFGAGGDSNVATRSVDTSISVGDVFEWQVRRSDGSGSKTASINTISQRADDRYVRIGIPIKESDL
jgi:hypothetical protein